MADVIAIHHPQDPSRPTVIKAARFDPKKHKRWTEPSTDEVQHGAEHTDDGREERADEEDGALPDEEVTDTDADD